MSTRIRYALRTLFVLVVASISNVASAATATMLVPNTAPHGARTVIAGTALDTGAIDVSFTSASGRAPAVVVSRSATVVEIFVPPAATSGAVHVAVNGAAIASLPFTLAPDPAFVTVVTLAASDKAHDILKSPAAVAVISSTGTAVVADTMHHRIVTVSPTGQVTLLAGSGKPGLTDGSGAQAQFKQPGGVAVDETRKIIYVADTANDAIRAVTYDGRVSTLVSAGLKHPSGLALDAGGTIYVADSENDDIKAITPSGAVTTFAGGVHEGFADGPAAQALFKKPAGIAVTSDGVVIVADSGNNRIRKIDHGVVSTIAGTGHDGFVDGSAAVAELKQPAGVAVDDAGNIFVADSGNHAIRKIANGNVSTVAGTGKEGATDGPASAAQFKQPLGVAVAGALFVADSGNDAIRIVAAPPQLAAIYPTRGPLSGGNTVRLFGTSFIPGATSVTFGGVAAPEVIFVSSTELLVKVPPASAGTVDVTVTTPFGTDTLTSGYSYVPPPTISSVTPAKGKTAGGETVTIVGTNYIDGDTTVTVGGAPASVVQFVSPATLTITTPPGNAGPADVVVTTPGGAATLAGGFTYFAPPAITSVTPAKGFAGAVVTISGQNFDPELAGNQLLLGTTAVTITSATPTQIVFAVPNGASTGKLTLTTAGGTVQSTTDFVVPVLTSIAVSPAAATIIEGQSQAFTATGTYSDNSTKDLTTTAAWSASDTALATIAASGVATAVKYGVATITASVGAVHGSATLTIQPRLTALTLAPQNATIKQGATEPFALTASYSDGSTKDATKLAQWSVSDSSVATVDANGVVTTTKYGVVMVAAKLDPLSASTQLTILPIATKVVVAPATLTVNHHTTGQLTATATYSDGSIKDATSFAAWSSSAPAIAGVASGTVTGLAPGTATISAAVDAASGSATVTVVPVLTGITVAPSALSINHHASGQLTATASYSDGSTNDATSAATWTSSPSAVASVAAGTVSGVFPGSATITANLGSFSASSAITVVAVPTALAVNPSTLTINHHATATLTATETFSDNTTKDVTATATWTTNAPNTASVTAGTVTGVTPGQATITASIDNLNASSAITVVPVLTGVSVAPATLTVPHKGTGQLTATATYSDSSTQDVTTTADWTTSASEVATASAGTVNGVAPGQATITATFGGFSANSSITVAAVPISLAIAPASLTVNHHATASLVATETFSDNTTRDVTATATWTSSAAGIASANAGTVSGVAPGSATITAAIDKLSATAAVTVTAVLTGVTVTPSTVTLKHHATTLVTATATYSDGTTKDVTATATWASSATAVATVNAGTVSGVAPGTATITATYASFSAAATITVVAVPVALAVTPASLTIGQGATATLAANVTFSDQTTKDESATATWTTSNAAVATVSAGSITAVAPGQATITAAAEGLTGAATITVIAVLKTITITGNASLVAGQTTQLSAAGSYSDGTTSNLNGTATWTSSAPSVATVSAGLVTGVGPGSATITAAQNNVSATWSVTVVSPVTIVALTVSPSTLNLSAGDSRQLSATATYSDSSTKDVTATATWTSGDSGVANISATGLLQATAAGATTITASVGGLTTSVPVQVAAATPLPPDPATIAPALVPTTGTSVADQVRFLYSGPNAIQTGVAGGAIDDNRATALRGMVRGVDGTSLPGVKITVLNHPELGQTFSRADGAWDFALNGGGAVTLQFAKTGYLPAQRLVTSQWHDWKPVDDVVLTAYDSAVTRITFGSSAQVARGNSVTDVSGTRRATVVFPVGTTATLKMADGSSQSATALSVRATELTVGPSGPQAMPAALPATSGYTYCVDVSADEAVSAGAASVQFSTPVAFYVENFLGFPVGAAVPVASYDSGKAMWIPSTDGRVIKIVSIDSGGAHVDTDGDGVADDTGIDAAERTQLASLYTAGATLWRITVSHFSPMDANFGVAAPADATVPKGTPTVFAPQRCGDAQWPNQSTILCESQSLGEELGLQGTPFTLHYTSDRTPGRVASRTMDIPLTGTNVPASLKRVELEITIAGTSTRQTFSNAPNQSYRYTWNGLDAFGRPVPNAAGVVVRTSYVYDGEYLAASRLPASFGVASGQRSGIPGRIEVQASQIWRGILGSWSATSQRIGGWTLDVHHFYDSASHTLYRGDGSRATDVPQRFAAAGTSVITTVAGTGLWSDDWTGVGGPATQAHITIVEGMTVGPDGSLYLASDDFIHRVTPDGTLLRVAGKRPSVYEIPPSDLATTQPAATAQLWRPRGMSFGPDGSLYIAEPYNHMIRKITPDGMITPVAGVGGNSGAGFMENVPALGNPVLSYPVDVAVSPDGSIYVVDSDQQRVRRIGPDGIITTVAGDGTYSDSGDGGPAIAASIENPSSIAVGPDGSIYVATDSRIRRIGPDGIITTVAGNGTFGGKSADGIPATLAPLDLDILGPTFLSIAADGSVIFADGARVRRVDPSGILTTIAGTGVQQSRQPDGSWSLATNLDYIEPVTAGPDGTVYFSESNQNYPTIRAIKLSLPAPVRPGAEITVPDGSLVHVFTREGLHLRTVDADTGVVLYSFSYTNGLLTAVTDIDGNVTSIERNLAGDATAIIASGGQRTEIAGAPYATSIATAPGETTQFTYTADGLMTGKIDPRQAPSSYTWNSLGLLTRDAGPEGNSVDGARTEVTDGHTVAMTTAAGRTTQYTTTTPSNGDETRTSIDPAGLVTTTVRLTDATAMTTLPDGSTVTTKEDPDPLWSTQAPFTSSLTLRLPSGRTFVATTSRTAKLTNPADPLSVSSRSDSVTINGNNFDRHFDRSSLTDTLVSYEGRVNTLTRDTSGRLVGWSMPTITPVGMSYDARGRLQSITQGTRQQTFGYNTRNELTSVTDALNRTVGFGYDAAGRVTTQTLPDLRQIHFAYDANGNLTSVTPPSRPGHAFSFTASNLVGTYTPPDDTPGGATTYRYNADRQLTLVTRPDAQTIALDYDAAGRLSTITTTAATLSYGYDSAGRLATVSNSNGVSLGYSYDGPLLTQQQWSGAVSGSIGFTYNDDLRLASESVNGSSTIAFGYDGDGLLTSAGALALTRDNQTSLVTGSNLGNLTDAWSYNAFGEPSSFSATYAGNNVFSETMTRDDAGRITAKTETYFGTSTSFAYGYDPAGRLQTVTNGNAVTTYNYDDNGNRVSKTASSSSESGTYDAQDRLLTYNGATFSYNANGDLTQKTDASGTTTYSYDALGNLRTVQLPDGRVIDYVIDAQNRRVGKKINGVLVKGWLYSNQVHVAAELDGTGTVVSRFIYASRSNVPDYMIKGGVTYRIISDHLGSPRVVIDANTGVVAWNNSYDEFGNPVPGSPEFLPFGFAGGLFDADTKLVRFGVRDYDAQTGQWTTKDPIRFYGGNANLYSYSANDPENFFDPSGLEHVQEPGFTKPLSDRSGPSIPDAFGLRSPDFISANVNVAIPTPWTGSLFGWSGTVAFDRFGNWYWSIVGAGIGKSATMVSGSCTMNWVNQRAKPTPKQLIDFLTQHGFNGTAGFWGGVTEGYTPGSGWTTGFGVVTPQIGVSYNYSYRGGSTGGHW